MDTPKVIPIRRSNPPGNVVFPSQSIFSFLIVPNSRNLEQAQMVAKRPIGYLSRK